MAAAGGGSSSSSSSSSTVVVVVVVVFCLFCISFKTETFKTCNQRLIMGLSHGTMVHSPGQ